jgi:hypothetical protein
MEQFLKFIKTPPFVNKDHVSLVNMKQEILAEKVLENMIKDFGDPQNIFLSIKHGFYHFTILFNTKTMF